MSRIPLTIEEVERRLFEIHGNIVKLDRTTYKNTQTKCRFIDKDYGEFWVKPNMMFFLKIGHNKKKNLKRKQTNLLKYGTEHPLQNKNIQEKRNSNLMNKFGTTCTFKVKSQDVIEKRKQTNLKKYGFDHPMKNSEIALKQAKACNNCIILVHWFSNEEIVCTASYEKLAVEHFNKNHIDYNWQPQIFLMPNGKTFRPDLYLPDEDKWIEIKGYFRDDAEEKWNWFHKEYPNSELWDKAKLKEMGIL